MVLGDSLWFFVVLGSSWGSWWLVLGSSWLFLVIIGGSWWFLVVLGGYLWFLMVLGGSHNRQEPSKKYQEP